MLFTPVMQTKFVSIHGYGDCFSCCLSSVTGISLEAFPEEFHQNFALNGFWQVFADWFEKRDMQIFANFIECGLNGTPVGRHLVTLGKSPRNKEYGHTGT